MASPSDEPPFPERANYGCVNCGSINHTTGDKNWCPAERDLNDPDHPEYQNPTWGAP